MVAISREEFRGELPLPFLSQFDRMIPEIRRHGQSALFELDGMRPELPSEEIVRGAFEVFMALVRRGLGDLAYPQPLAMTAVERLSSSDPQ
jgi:hypothetical protein